MTPDGLIAEYLFSGNADDTSGYSRHGVVHGATLTADRFGNANSAFHFDGVDDYIVVDPPPAIGAAAFSVSAWVRYDKCQFHGWTNCVIAQDDGNDEDQSRRVFQVSTFMGRLVWHRMVQARDPTCRRPIRPEVWFHVVATYENGQHRIFVDGELYDTVQHRFWTHASQPMHIGHKGTNEPYFFFHGDIDDIRLYNRALHDADIRALFTEAGWTSSPQLREEPLSGRWGQFGAIMLDLKCDPAGVVTGKIMARDPGYMQPVAKGSFHHATGALRLEGTARHPDNGSPVPWLIEGRLIDGEVTVAATFTMPDHVNSGNYILTRDGAKGGWWKNSFVRWRLRKLRKSPRA